MEIKHYSFSIADVNLKFEYTETYELDDDTPYIKFRYDGDNFDVINYISIYDHVNKPTFDGTEQIIQFCPSWTIYRYNDKKVVEFHPNDSYIGYIETKDEWSMCHTKVLNGYSQTQLLPISMTGFLCQQIILKRGNTGFFMHGATVMVKGKNIILTGNSGVGKSTLSRLLKKYENGVRITDDRFILLEDDETFYSCGNPFDMKNDECDNVKVKLMQYIFFTIAK